MNDVFLKDPLEETKAELAQLQEQYEDAVVVLRAVKAQAQRFAKSGNPGRRLAGLDILDTLGLA